MKAIDLFAGCGGLSLGLLQAGIEVVAAVEWDADACATYRANIGAHVIQGDIATVAAAELPDCDLIAGGPPCQGFSFAGKRDSDDPRNQLWREYFRIVETKRPACILMENVEGMRSAGVEPMIIQAFRSIGYEVNAYLLNSADYGVPQTRKRLFFIGNRLGVANPVPIPTHAGFKKHRGKLVKAQLGLLGLPPQRTVRDALGIGGAMTHTRTPETSAANGIWYDGDDRPARVVTHVPHGVLEDDILDWPSSTIRHMNGGHDVGRMETLGLIRPQGWIPLPDDPSGTNRPGAHCAPGYSPRHQAGYMPMLDEPSATIHTMGGGAVTTERQRVSGYVPDDVIARDVARLDEPALTVTHGSRRGKRGSDKYPGNFIPTTRDDHGVIDLDSPSCVIKAGGVPDHVGKVNGPTPPAMPVHIRNRYAQHGDGPQLDEPGPTVSADRTLEVEASGVRLRRLTPRECATLQDFPPDFAFVGTKTSQHRQIGNAVAVGMGRALGCALRAAFEKATQ